MIIKTNTLNYTLAAILSIMMEEKEIYLVMFHSYMFKAAKLNYNIHNKVLLVVFKVFSHLVLLFGKVRTFYRYYLLYTHPKTSDPSNSIMINTYLKSTPPKISVEVDLIIWLLMTLMELWTSFPRTLVYPE